MAADTDIAVIGAGCRFPDATGPAEFWPNLDAGRVSIRELTDERLREGGVSEELASAPDFVRMGTTLPGVADFAGEFFGYQPAEVDIIDPQQRIFLETCWEAMESSGHTPGTDNPVVGVFAGSAAGTYSAAVFAARTQRDGLAAAIDDLGLTLGGQADFLTSRTAYKLGPRGPAVSVQTACSSSLYAVHYAGLSLLAGECDIALAGGSTVLEPIAGYRYLPGGLLSEDGLCRSFDLRSTGTSFSSGVGVVALRRLSDALADGDPVLAVLRGSAVGNDGAHRQGYTAPSPLRVAEVVAGALAVAGIGADDLCYVEAHGSGTALGDHVELTGLSRALRGTTRCTGFCGLGSVKTNIGHCGPASGIAGFLKAVHIAGTGALPPHPLFEQARDPGVLAESPLFVSSSAGTVETGNRHVLVNSMGVGGTNVAAVLAAAPAPSRRGARSGELVRLVVSARTRTELDALSKRLADHIDRGTDPIGDVAHTLRVGRSAFPERRVVTAPPDRIASALRLPRPPLARTARTSPARAAVVLPADGSVPDELLAPLTSVLSAEVHSGSLPADRFVVLVNHGTPGPDRHVLTCPPAPGPDRIAELLDEAAAAAWLHGVAVDWATLSGSDGRRVTLPTYPFQRRRYWALDRLPSLLAPPNPATAQAPVPAEAKEPGETSLIEDLCTVWQELFGVDRVGPDDEFGALGGTSLLSVQMVLEIQQRHGVLVNIHRAGGSRTTVRRLAELVRGQLGDDPHIDRIADGDGDLMDADLRLPLGDRATEPNGGTDILLTGATGFLGSFLLHELSRVTTVPIHCVVRADSEADGWERVCAAVARFALPAPDPARVRIVPGDLRAIDRVCREHHDGELGRVVGHIVHCAARVVFTEPYRVLRQDNVRSLVDLLRWARGSGIEEFSFVSTVAATSAALGANGRVLETRAQSLDPQQGGYGASKWVGERLLERAELDGMRVRVFRPGFLLAAEDTGACNDKDLIWHILASGLAVGAHPQDDRGMPMCAVDVVARAIAELAFRPGSVGRAYHLVDRRCLGLRAVFELLADAGLPTKPLPAREWQELVAKEALATGNTVLSTMALYELEGHTLGEDDMEAVAWQPWLAERHQRSAPTGALLRDGLTFLAAGTGTLGAALRDVLTETV